MDIVLCEKCRENPSTCYTIEKNYDNCFYCAKCRPDKDFNFDKPIVYREITPFTLQEKISARIKCEYTDGCTNDAIDWTYKWITTWHRVQKKHFICGSCMSKNIKT
jgi:hypothetical protein